jgi:His-Xaa-Ser system protein HxsD
MTDHLEDWDAITCAMDELGTFARIVVDLSVYSKTAVFKTAYWYTEHLFLFLSRGERDNTVEIEMRSKEGSNRETLIRFCREFCNALIDQQVRQDVIRETSEIRDVLVRKAFGEGRKHLNPAILRSDESAIPTPRQSYRDDPLGINQPAPSE